MKRSYAFALSITIFFLLSLSTAVAAPALSPPAPSAPAQAPVAAEPAATAAPDDDKSGPPSLFEEPQQNIGNYASIVVRIRTPRNMRAEDVFTLYPYPPKPPATTQAPNLPVSGKGLRGMLLTTGYAQRPNLDKPYQVGGWRWIYAFKAGVAKSGKGEPHTIASMYQWADDVAPWVARECEIRNKFEKERFERYLKAVDYYNKNHVDIENDAIRQGLSPIALSHREWSTGRGRFPAGTWWLQVTRKTPGLTYYWLQPITAAPDQQLSLTLDENNALVISGGW